MTFCSVNLDMFHALVLVETFMRCPQVNFLTSVLHFGHILAITNMNEQPCPTDFILQPQCKMRQRGNFFYHSDWPSISDDGPEALCTVTFAFWRIRVCEFVRELELKIKVLSEEK